MPFQPSQAQKVHSISYKVSEQFPILVLLESIQAGLGEKARVAILATGELTKSLEIPGAERLDPQRNYQWSGFLVQKKVEKPASRVIVGQYTDWFQWYMSRQRFRAFHTVMLLDPIEAVADRDTGGYIDGFLVRLMDKAKMVVIIAKGGNQPQPPADEIRVKEVARALLYGTRLSGSELLEQASKTMVQTPLDRLQDVLERSHWRISKTHPRLRLRDHDQEMVQGLVGKSLPFSTDEESKPIEQLFRRRERLKVGVKIPEVMLRGKALEDVKTLGWVTTPDETGRISTWLKQLSEDEDERIVRIYKDNEDLTDQEWNLVLNPRRGRVRDVLNTLVMEKELARTILFKEVGRPTNAYHLPGNSPFLKSRCGQCAFYIPLKRRCRLWWLVNKQDPFFHPRWTAPNSKVSGFERHKMEFASRIGPHSSACTRFIDKKRDHQRKGLPEVCTVCGVTLTKAGRNQVTTCGTCGTRYVRRLGKVRVYTSYKHEFDRYYHEITGGNADQDMQRLKAQWSESRIQRQSDDDEPEGWSVESTEGQKTEVLWRWPAFSEPLQIKVDRLAIESDITKRLSIAMAESALNATKKIVGFANLPEIRAQSSVQLQQKYVRALEEGQSASFLPYEALTMRQYWLCYNLALKGVQAAFGPRKKSRFVREFVEDPAGRARGYSAIDAAINYLHQRRVNLSLRMNAEVGFEGICDGFLHRRRYNSRRVGLIFDMIDPFKFADREVLLSVALSGGLSWKEFNLATDRRGSTFYYPTPKGKAILDQAGRDADEVIVTYLNRQMDILEAYRRFATSLSSALQNGFAGGFEPFSYLVS